MDVSPRRTAWPILPPKSPGVSVVITSYNYSRFIGRTISSARSTEIADLEIIIVDNASTDESWEIIQAAAVADSRIRAYRNETNIGMIGNHSRGLELATKPKVLFVSADDYLLPGHLARLLATHAEHPEIDYVFTAYVHVDEDDRLIRYVKHVGHPHGSYFGGRNEFADLLTYDCYACMPTTLFDREEMTRTGFDPAIIANDYDHYLRLAAEGKRFAFLDTAGVALRIHAAEFGGKERYMATGKQLLDQIAIVEKHLTKERMWLVAGREGGVAGLIGAKVHNLSQFPEVSSQVMPAAQPRIDRILEALNESRQSYLSTRLPAQPRISAILVANDDIASLLETIDAMARQTYSEWELVIVLDGTQHIAPLLLDRARGLNVKMVHHAAPQRRGASLNDGLTLASGDIVAYADAGVLWPAHHLEVIARHFCGQSIEALVVSADCLVYRHDPGTQTFVDVAQLESFSGSKFALDTVHVGEAVPLATFAHRRGIIDRFGRFDEQLEQLTDFEFVSRVFDHLNTGLDDEHAVLVRRRVDLPAAPIQDPNRYLRELQDIYGRHTVKPDVLQKRQRHLQLVHAELDAIAKGELLPDLLRFAKVARGAQSL